MCKADKNTIYLYNKKILNLTMDINLAYQNSIGFVATPLIFSNIDKFIQEIDLALSLGKYEIFGRNRLNDSTIESIMWGTSVSEQELKNFIENKLRKECYLYNEFNVTIESYFMQGEQRDMCVVDMNIVSKDNQNRRFSILYK